MSSEKSTERIVEETSSVKHDQALIFEISRPGRIGYSLPNAMCLRPASMN